MRATCSVHYASVALALRSPLRLQRDGSTLFQLFLLFSLNSFSHFLKTVRTNAFGGNFCCVWHSRNDRHTDSADVIVMIYDVVCFQMTQWRHLGNVGQTNSVVMTTAALILLNDATELMTVQMALMKMSAVGLITMSSNRIFLVTLF